MIEYLRGYSGPPLKIMEVCGTHTAAIFRSGIRSFLPAGIRLVSGPGCPVCVTPASYIDDCVRIAETPGYCLACFGDMLKVSGTRSTLSDVLGRGGHVRMVYAPFDVLPLAAENPETVFVVAAVGFETTAPAYALLIEEAAVRGLDNVKLLVSLKSALAAIEFICESEDVDAFLCPGHVSVITGSRAYESIAARYKKPFIVAGFEGEHILAAVYQAASDIARVRGDAPQRAPVSPRARAMSETRVRLPHVSLPEAQTQTFVRNLYPEAVSVDGNTKATALIERYFNQVSVVWRGLGTIANSGYVLRSELNNWNVSSSMYDVLSPQDSNTDASWTNSGADALLPDPDVGALPPDLDVGTLPPDLDADMSPPGCRCRDVILGRVDPNRCPLFGKDCTPAHAVGPCMVSSEGACGIWFRNRI
jgi:hydrogenase expression/formation protein HypD